MRRIIMALLLISGAALPYVVGYHVEPVKALWSGWVLGDVNHGVSQTLTINFDELDSTGGAYCELFAGAEGGGGAYHVSVRTYPGDVEIGYGDHGGNVDHKWVRFNLHVYRPDSVIKGKQLEFRFTRSNGDSIEFYYAENAYDYGHIVIGGGQLLSPPGSAPDLCMRVYGRMNPRKEGHFPILLTA